MTDLHAEALEYPADHREAALELLLQKQLLVVQLHGADEKLKRLRDRTWFAATRWSLVGVAIAFVAGICAVTGLVDGKIFDLVAAGGAIVVLIAFYVNIRARRQIDRITQEQEAVTDIDAALNGLQHDIGDLESWQTSVRLHLSEKLDHRASFETKKAYLILALGCVALFILFVVAVKPG